jgi:hypothetical protein
MRIETFKIEKQYRGITLVGICRVIPPSTYSVTMEKPYKGLAEAEYFRNNDGGYSIEKIKGRAQWELGRLYEQFQGILYEYDKYKKLLDEWMSYEQKIQRMKEEVAPFRQRADAEKLALLDFHTEMLDRDAKEHFYELMEKYGIKPLSLSPSVLETSIGLIEKGFCNR